MSDEHISTPARPPTDGQLPAVPSMSRFQVQVADLPKGENAVSGSASRRSTLANGEAIDRRKTRHSSNTQTVHFDDEVAADLKSRAKEAIIEDSSGDYVEEAHFLTRNRLPQNMDLDLMRSVVLTTHRRGDMPELQATLRQIDLQRKLPQSAELELELERSAMHESSEKLSSSDKLGWINGVLIRCVLNIFGVMLFIRLSWIVGQAGIWQTILIILLSSSVTTITTLSMSAICTNGVVRGGGAYFMISRCLGPELGGSIGLVFSFANAVGVAMYVVGFAESLRDLIFKNQLDLESFESISEVNWVRLIGAPTAFIILGLCFFGTKSEGKVQLIMLVVMTVALANYFIGTFIVTDWKSAKGFTGYQAGTLAENLGPEYTKTQDFRTLFSIFFPAATGILAGANVSGDLKDPSTAIPRGTLGAIAITTLVYIALAVGSAATVTRNHVYTFSRAVVGGFVGNSTVVNTTGSTMASQLSGILGSSVRNGTNLGLIGNYYAIADSSAVPQILWAGIFAATISSALTSMISAPKVFQSLGKDHLFPLLHIFARSPIRCLCINFTEPIFAYLLMFTIAFAFTMVGDLNAVAPLISNFFLCAYALINFACVLAELSRSPGWRPQWRFFYWPLSLLGAMGSLAIMFLIDPVMAFVTLACVGLLLMFLWYRQPDANWGTSWQALAYNDALHKVQKFAKVPDHPKNYRPQILVFSGYPVTRPALVDLAHHISLGRALLMCANVVGWDESEWYANRDKYWSDLTSVKHYFDRRADIFYKQIVDVDFRRGCRTLMQSQGLGGLKCNIVMMGFMSNWRKDSAESIFSYYGVILDAFLLKYGVMLLRTRHRTFGEAFYEMEQRYGSKLPRQQWRRTIADMMASLRKQPQVKPLSTGQRARQTVSTLFGRVFPRLSQPTQSEIATQAVHEQLQTLQDRSNRDINRESGRKKRPWMSSTGPAMVPSNKSADNRRLVLAGRQQSISAEVELSSTPSPPLSPELVSPGSKTRLKLEQQVASLVEDEEDSAVDVSSAPAASTTSTTAAKIPAKLNKMLFEAINNASTFARPQTGTIDVYWLEADGGLTILVPFLLAQKPLFRKCSLRVFGIYDNRLSTAEDEESKMIKVLQRFRITVHSTTMLPLDVGDDKSMENLNPFVEFLKGTGKEGCNLLDSDDQSESNDWSKKQFGRKLLESGKHMIRKYVTLRSHILEHSKDACLICVSLVPPKVPGKQLHPSLYLAMVDYLTKDLPPVLLIRGANQQVLTELS